MEVIFGKNVTFLKNNDEKTVVYINIKEIKSFFIEKNGEKYKVTLTHQSGSIVNYKLNTRLEAEQWAEEIIRKINKRKK